MERIRNILVCALLAALVAVAIWAALLLRTATSVVGALPAELASTRADLVAEIQSTRAALLAEVDTQASGIRRDAVGQIAALRVDSLARVDALSAVMDKRTGEALGIVDARLSQSIGTIEGMRADLKPTLSGSAALMADAKDSWDDLFFDVKASIESGTVTMHSVAVASEAVEKAAPKLAESAVEMGRSTAGIEADIHTATSDFVKPKTTWQKFKSWLETAGKIGARFL